MSKRMQKYCVAYALDCGGVEIVNAHDEDEAEEIVMQMYEHGQLTAIKHDEFRVYEIEEADDEEADDGDEDGE